MNKPDIKSPLNNIKAEGFHHFSTGLPHKPLVNIMLINNKVLHGMVSRDEYIDMDISYVNMCNRIFNHNKDNKINPKLN
jgi:hypothetical protein